MPMFATIAVPDVAATTAWYEAALGFGVVFRAPGHGGQPLLVHLRRRKYQDLLITPLRGMATAPTSLTISFNVDGEIDELGSRAHAAAPVGASAVEGPVDTPWNTRDLRVTDPAGHELIFTARNPNPDPGNVARMKALFDTARKPQRA